MTARESSEASCCSAHPQMLVASPRPTEYRRQAMTEELVAFLTDLGAYELIALLENAEFESAIGAGVWDEPVRYLTIRCSQLNADALDALPPRDKQRLIEAWVHADPSIKQVAAPEADRLSFAGSKDLESPDPLLAEMVIQRGLMIDVATGGARINDVDDYFKARQKRIDRQLRARGLSNPVEFASLWDWYSHWNDTGMDSYRDRRRYVYDLFRPTIEAVVGSVAPPPSAPRPPTGWERVDRGIVKARQQLAEAQHEEDYQGIGLLCREILISLGQAVFDPEVHQTVDGVDASDTDAKRQLEAFLAAAVPGSSNETVRRHAKAAVALALELQHRRTADRKLARLCFEATASAVSVVSILADRF
jgi:hypothetical protein